MAEQKDGDPGRDKALAGLFGEARTRLLNELCGEPQTAAELARKVNTSANAVRVHLDGLRTAGLVDYRVERRGVGKPRHVYAITAAAENLLSLAYAKILRALLENLQDKLDGGFSRMLRDVGVSLADLRATNTRRGIPAAVRALESLGAQVSVTKSGAARELHAQCCPLAAVTRDTPPVCELVESFLASASGMRVTEECVRGAHPRCHFLISAVA